VDFSLSEEQQEIQRSVRAFVERELFPLDAKFCREGRLPLEQRIELQQRARELGFWALDVPQEEGGAGLAQLTLCLIYEEAYRSPLMFDFGGSVEPVLYKCTEQQKTEYLRPIVRGERRSCFAFTEPNTGSDLAAIRTRAEMKGGDWVINGCKTFISEVEGADFIILFAKTDPAKGARGLSCLLVDKNSAGLSISAPIQTMGDGWAPNSLYFSDCRVPKRNLLGELNDGFSLANELLRHGRLKIAAWNVGVAQRCHELAIAYSKERSTFGAPIADRQAIQWMIADSEVEITTARLVTHKAAWLADCNRDYSNEAFLAKLHASETAFRVADRALQVFGGMGYTLEVPVASFFRQTRLWRIGHGTSEIHRMMIARRLLKC